MPAASLRTSYSLQFDDDGVGLPKRIEFEAASAGIALEIEERECDGRWALLVCDGQALCRVGHNGGTWTILACPPLPQADGLKDRNATWGYG